MSDFLFPDETRIKALFEHSEELIKRCDIAIQKSAEVSKAVNRAIQLSEKYMALSPRFNGIDSPRQDDSVTDASPELAELDGNHR